MLLYDLCAVELRVYWFVHGNMKTTKTSTISGKFHGMGGSGLGSFLLFPLFSVKGLSYWFLVSN